MSRIRLLLCLCGALAAAGCSDADDVEPTEPVPPVEEGLPATCNPLRATGVCLLPYPSAIYQEEDPSTESGYRMALTSEVLPRSANDVAYEPTRLNAVDGFSVMSQILAYFPEPIDAASLPPIDDPARSLEPGSATVVVDVETGERVAHFSEVDAQVYDEDDKQALIIRPVARLDAGRRYAVGITTATRTLDGEVPASPPGWGAIVGGGGSVGQGMAGQLAAKQAARMPEVLAALESAGVAQSELVLAWDFVTASDASPTRALRSMREQTLAQLGDAGLGYTIDSVEEEFDEHTLRRVRGTFQVPKFISQTDPTVAEAKLQYDADGLPMQDGVYDAPFTLILPRAAATAPVKLLLFGHGFLGSGEGELGDAEGSYLQSFADAHGYALIATDWSGLSQYEGLDPAGSSAAAKALEDINHFGWISDRLQQAIVNAITLARTARGAIAKDPALFVGGVQVIEDDRIDYYGISLGGVLGSVLMGYSPDLERGVLNVGAAGWSLLMQRSTNWSLFKLVLDGTYPDKLEQQILIDIIQSHLDPADGMTIAARIQAPLAGNPPKQVLLQMAVADAQVPNVATEAYARTLALPLLDDSPKDIYGLTRTAGPLSSALTVWDTKEEDVPPPTNTAASATTDNQAHGTIRALPMLEAQIDTFFRTGEVISTCDSVCDPQ